MNDKIYNLAKKMDDINYDHDTYGYKDSLDTTDTLDEGRLKAIKEIYIDLIEGNIKQYIDFLNDIIEEGKQIKDYSLEQIQKLIKELNQFYQN